MAFDKIAYENIGENLIVTFKSALTRGTDEDKPVKISANDTVALAGNDEAFVGFVKNIDIHDAKAAVQMNGFVTATYSGTAPTVGYCKLEGAGSGAVKVDAVNGKEYIVVNVDTTNSLVTFLLA